jgi:hypothetical protein
VVVKIAALTIGLAALTAAAAASGTANATISGSAGSTVQTLKPGTKNKFVTQTFGQGSNTVTTPTGGGFYNSYVSISPTEVSFESANAVSGSATTGTSTSAVSFTFTNTGSKTITPKFQSSIVPAGMGFYLADTSGGCGGNVYAGCPVTSGPYSFSQLNFGGVKTKAGLASASFDFTVLSDGNPIYNLAGSLLLDGDHVVQTNFGQTDALNNFGLASPAGSTNNVGYTWGATPLNLTLAPLAGGASRTLTYQVTVSSFSQNVCINPTTCLVAYSGFGDPVGGGNGINLALGGLQLQSPNGPTGNGGFFPVTFNLPNFNNGVITFGPAGVPEPRTWLMLLLGTATMGAALRRTRRARLMA